MPSPLEQAGSKAPKETRFAPIYSNRFFTGLWTNRNPLRDAATPFLYEKFYSATRAESVIDGLNMEMSARLTPVTRPGHSVYNSQVFPAINRFYPFRVSNTATETIKVIADTAATVYDATGPSTQQALFTKAAGAGTTRFLGLGNRLFMGDGVSQSKYFQTLVVWPANTNVTLGQLIIDSNFNVQQVTTPGLTGGSIPAFSNVVRGTTTDNAAVWTNRGNAVQGWGIATPAVPTVLPPTSPDIFHVRFWAANHTYGAAATGIYVVCDGLNMQVLQDGTKVTGSSLPVWNTVFGGLTPDGTASWLNIGGFIPAGTFNFSIVHNLLKFSTLIDFNGNIQCTLTGGNTAGTGAPAFSTTPGGTVVDGTVTWTCMGSGSFISAGYSWGIAYHTFDGHYGTLSPQTPSITIMGQGPYTATVNFTGLADGQCDYVYLFRTLSGQPTLCFASQTANPGAIGGSFTDTVLDANLNQFIQGALAHGNDPPPAGLTNLIEHMGRIWGSVGNVLYYSSVNSATTPDQFQSFPPNNTFTAQSNIVRCVSTAIGLLVFTTTKVHIVTGQGITGVSPFNMTSYLANLTLLNYDALTINGSTLYMLDGRKREISFDPSSGISHVGLPIADQFKALYNASTAYCTWHTQDGLDDALYVADGALGWFRLNPTPAPESGMTWSPRALVVGGTKCVQSVETAPGVHQLLVGTATSGPILFRDPTVFKDNGQQYSSTFIQFGSIVLAQPGQIAELSFIAQDLPRVGTRPKVSVRLNEIGGGFINLPTHVRTPTYLPESSTLFSDRWYFAATKKPAYCNHMQIRFDFNPADNVQNEMYTYTIFGAILKEK